MFVDSFMEFLAMGGYAFYVWSSFAITAVLLLGIVLWSNRQFKNTQAQVLKRARQPRSTP